MVRVGNSRLKSTAPQLEWALVVRTFVPQMPQAEVRCLARHERLGPNYAGVVATLLMDGSPEVRRLRVESVPRIFAQ